LIPGKKRKLENYHIPGRDSRHSDLASFVRRRVEKLEYIKDPKTGLIYKARIYEFDTRHPIHTISAHQNKTDFFLLRLFQSFFLWLFFGQKVCYLHAQRAYTPFLMMHAGKRSRGLLTGCQHTHTHTVACTHTHVHVHTHYTHTRTHISLSLSPWHTHRHTHAHSLSHTLSCTPSHTPLG